MKFAQRCCLCGLRACLRTPKNMREKWFCKDCFSNSLLEGDG